MVAPFYLALPGVLTLTGKRPDGDSVRFIPQDPAGFDELYRADRIRFSADGSVQLRLEGIDAPELHYGGAAQPLGAEARDALLEEAGFTQVRFGGGDDSPVIGSTPATIPAVVLTQAVELNGRPVSYLLTSPLAAGDWVRVDRSLLARTLNVRMLELGLAYLTVYTSTPASHRRWLREIAATARRARLGVWAVDQTADFLLGDQGSIGPGGALVLPKLFRRATDYLRDVGKGYRGDLRDWIRDPARDQNDGVLLDGREVRLADLVSHRGGRVRFSADLLDVTFVER